MIRVMMFTLLVGCGGESTAPSPKPEAPIEDAAVIPKGAADLAKVAKAIEANPSEKAKILESNGLDEDSYAQALFDVAADPAQAAAYAAAYGE